MALDLLGHPTVSGNVPTGIVSTWFAPEGVDENRFFALRVPIHSHPSDSCAAADQSMSDFVLQSIRSNP